ncbi:TonB-dependent receptor [Sphingobacterium sp. lm-10]|uniref:SusC/RagA family TonB-linked outer membrane protein n=1 Tax=Sphingobacterium sp. lm-10 TaxID=2944904 RepID=UPI0020207386|nr:TonB-dependent receptor [Sphingobacterium sp. lm-10]MCL7986833.1 TonB-dependent receptor [Sphingobacterium sp. lm-10]
MKLIVFFMLLLHLQSYAKVHAQNKITMQHRSISITALLNTLESKTDYRFVFNQDALASKGTVNINAKNESVINVLKKVLGAKGISFTEMENNLIVINNPASQQRVSGEVKDTEGNPLVGVSVRIKGTDRGTSTDQNGQYNLEVATGETLTFSFIGFLPTEVRYTGQQTIQTVLEVAAEGLDEIVVVGYGTQRKVNLTGSVSTVKSEDINRQVVGQATQALQGLSAGLTVTTNSGQPGRDQGMLNIRGMGTLNDSSPLILVDGIRYDNSISLNDIDANDIENISVLKDAAAASIYGVRAANGVILVTTKRGAQGGTQVSYGNYFGWQEAIRTPDFVGAQSFMQLVNQMNTNAGNTPVYNQDRINAYNDPNRDMNQFPDNYWFGDILTGSGFQQKHSMSLAGGNEKNKYRFSANYFDQAGLIKNMDFNRLTIRLNTDFKISEKLNFNADISGRLSGRNEPQAAAGSAWFQFGQASRINPLESAKDENGNWRALRGEHNVLRLQEEGGIFSNNDRLFTTNFRLNYLPVEGLMLSAVASNNFQNQYLTNHSKRFNYVNASSPIGRDQITKNAIGYINQNYQGLAEYTKVINDHDFKFLGGASYLGQRTDDLLGTRFDMPNNNLTEIDAGSEASQLARGTAREYTLISFFGRVNYAFKGKYLLEANLRRDGSSRFSNGQRWGWFPSASVGWRVSEEAFMQDVRFVQDLKIRASYGRLGNDAIGDYPYQSNYILRSYPFGGVLNPSTGLQIYPNSGLTWETTDIANLGLDFTLFNRLNVTLDIFDKQTNDILLQLPIPEAVGLEASFQNAASVRNRGWELSLNYNQPVNEDFRFNVALNLSDVRNEILDLKGTDYNATDGNGLNIGNYVGRPIGSYYGYLVDGIYQNDAQVAGSTTLSGQVGPGDLIYRDINGDGVFDNTNDFAYLGSNIPRFNYGLTLGANYKGFDFSAFFQGVAKVDINTLNLERAPINQDGNFRSAWLDAWTTDNAGSAYPRLVPYQTNYQPSDFWVQSGAYVRLKNVTIGYKLPKSVIGNSFISNLRLFAGAQNLFTITSLPKDLDPESPNDNRFYPQVRTISFGLNANF